MTLILTRSWTRGAKYEIMLVSYRDKATFAAHQSYLRSRGRCSHVMPAALPPKTGGRPQDFTPKNHRNTLRSPKMDFKVDGPTRPPVIMSSEIAPGDACERDEHGVRTRFARSFRGKKPRDSLPDIAKVNRAFLQFPFKNPKPHDFRALDDKVADMQLRRLCTPDPLNLHLKLQALSGDHTHPYKDIEATHYRGEGKFLTSRSKSPKFSKNKYFPKERYNPAFSAHDALLDRMVCTLAMLPCWCAHCGRASDHTLKASGHTLKA